MQIVLHVRREHADLADVLAIDPLRQILRTVAPPDRDMGSHDLLQLVGRVQSLSTRQDKRVDPGRTYSALHNEQVRIICRNVCLKLLNTARQCTHAHHETKHNI